jgi:RNA polymerase sigma-70 factor (ECF subfamily)
LSAIVNTYVDAWARSDVDTIVEMLTEDATLAMPPNATWFRGRDAIAIFLRAIPLDGTKRWRLLPTSANGQVAMGGYRLDRSGAYVPYTLNVLGLRGDRVVDVTAFRDPSLLARFGLPRRA